MSDAAAAEENGGWNAAIAIAEDSRSSAEVRRIFILMGMVGTVGAISRASGDRDAGFRKNGAARLGPLGITQAQSAATQGDAGGNREW